MLDLRLLQEVLPKAFSNMGPVIEINCEQPTQSFNTLGGHFERPFGQMMYHIKFLCGYIEMGEHELWDKISPYIEEDDDEEVVEEDNMEVPMDVNGMFGKFLKPIKPGW